MFGVQLIYMHVICTCTYVLIIVVIVGVHVPDSLSVYCYGYVSMYIHVGLSTIIAVGIHPQFPVFRSNSTPQ